MRKLLFAVVVVAAAVAGYFYFGQGAMNADMPIRVDGAFARASGNSAKAGAAFMTIHNQSGQDDRLIAAKAEVAGMVELHTHIQDANGVMMMRPIEGGIAVPNGGEAVLKRGGDHVMLMGLIETLNDGDKVKLTLTFEKAGDVVLEVPVNNEN